MISLPVSFSLTAFYTRHSFTVRDCRRMSYSLLKKTSVSIVAYSCLLFDIVLHMNFFFKFVGRFLKLHVSRETVWNYHHPLRWNLHNAHKSIWRRCNLRHVQCVQCLRNWQDSILTSQNQIIAARAHTWAMLEEIRPWSDLIWDAHSELGHNVGPISCGCKFCQYFCKQPGTLGL